MEQVKCFLYLHACPARRGGGEANMDWEVGGEGLD